MVRKCGSHARGISSSCASRPSSRHDQRLVYKDIYKEFLHQILIDTARDQRHSAHNFAPAISTMVLEHHIFTVFHLLGVGVILRKRYTWQGWQGGPSGGCRGVPGLIRTDLGRSPKITKTISWQARERLEPSAKSSKSSTCTSCSRRTSSSAL